MRVAPARRILMALVALAMSALSPAGSAAEQTRATASAPELHSSPDYTAYQALLDEFLVVTSAKRQPLETRFDYSRLHDQPGRYERLKRIYDQLATVDPQRLESNDRRAWAINTYNFVVLRLITDNLVIPNSRSRERIRWGSVKDVLSGSGGFFERPAVWIAGTTYSLNEFEQKFVFDGYDRGPESVRPASLEPRAHFAVVCGSVGCPPLQPKVFRGATLDRQLDAAVRQSLASPRHLDWRPEEQVLSGSEIFSWYFRDFGGMTQTFEFAMAYAPPKVRAWAKKRGLREFSFFVPWDWSLNHTPKEG